MLASVLHRQSKEHMKSREEEAINKKGAVGSRVAVPPQNGYALENGRLIVLYPYLNVVGACVSPHQARVAVNFLGFSRVCHTI